jgi:hypothetical protein
MGDRSTGAQMVDVRGVEDRDDDPTVVDSFVDALLARVEPASRGIASRAAELRARHAGGFRLPDASWSPPPSCSAPIG